MDKLYAPLIESSIPAFYSTGETATLSIPFEYNRATTADMVNGMSLLIKSTQTNSILLQGIRGDIVGKTAQFDLTAEQLSKLRVGQYYRCQIAFVQNDVEGYYSDVGVIKYTSQPNLTIEYIAPNSFYGNYSNEGDKTEKVYSYSFSLTKTIGEETQELKKTEILLHNSASDIDTNSSTDFWDCGLVLETGEDISYSITYSATTNNNLVRSVTNTIEISKPTEINPITDFQAILIPEEGAIYLRALASQTLVGEYIINRRAGVCDINRFVSKETGEEFNETVNWGDWEAMVSLQLAETEIGTYIWEDYTIEQGRKYQYSIRRKDENLVESNEITADFFDTFLTDGERQLCIKFNPKVSSMKTNILEAKMDTLGGKYPFFFRNGQVCYKEFPLSGLLSIIGDDYGQFNLKHKERITNLNTNTPYTPLINSNLTGENKCKERDFKLAVEKWLTNGKPKLLRSPAEGNYVVRLMNTSMSPNDTLGRMLHTFNSTAYEFAEYSLQSIRDLGFFNFASELPFIPVSSVLMSSDGYYLMSNDDSYLIAKDGE